MTVPRKSKSDSGKPESSQEPARHATPGSTAGASRRGEAQPASGHRQQRGAKSRSASQEAPQARGNAGHDDAPRPPGAGRAQATPVPAQPPRSDALREDLDPEATPAGPAETPNLLFNTPRAPLDSDPDQHRAAAPGTTANANLTSHLNDPAMRRRPATPADGAPVSPSAISPLARDAATPGDEQARLRQEAAAADARARYAGIAPRGDVEKWHQAEENRQSDLPGSPRKDLPQ